MAEKSPYDVILLDYKLPDGDGIQFLETLEKNHIKTPVVIVTSRGDKAVQVKALEVGAVEYLSKGTFSTDLLEQTCIYAIGMQEKRNRNGGGPGVGILIEQLVELTRDSVRAQTEATAELRETRKELMNGISSLKEDMTKGFDTAEKDIKARRETCYREHTKIIDDIKSQSGFRWILDWIRKNTKLSIAIFICLLLTIALAVGLLNVTDTTKIRDLLPTTPAGYLVTPSGGK